MHLLRSVELVPTRLMQLVQSVLVHFALGALHDCNTNRSKETESRSEDVESRSEEIESRSKVDESRSKEVAFPW